MSNQAVEVEILGKLTRVNCPEGQEESLIKAAECLDERLKDMMSKTKITNEVQLLTFVALNFCHELETRDINSKIADNELCQRIEKLVLSLDKCIGTDQA